MYRTCMNEFHTSSGYERQRMYFCLIVFFSTLHTHCYNQMTCVIVYQKKSAIEDEDSLLTMFWNKKNIKKPMREMFLQDNGLCLITGGLD